jgi:serine/threonine-protein kinase
LSLRIHDPLLTASDDALVGRIIAGKFCLREVIGAGAAGSVYKADQTSLGRTVAVKVLRPEIASDPRFIRRFHDEARAASRLNHPNVVSVIDFGQTEEDGLLYLVMEYLRGVTLSDVMRKENLSIDRISDIIRQILSALEEAHEGGVVHADLKTDNTMVEHRRGGWDLVKVVDFGIARLTGSLDEQVTDDSVFGTPEYMAPEVIRGMDPKPATDIYAVGIMLYELLVGRTPFGGLPTLATLQRHLNDTPVAPSRRSSRAIPDYLEKAVMRALEKRPADRFATANAFAEALEPPISYQEAGPSTRSCTKCGAINPPTFKFCPECATPLPQDNFELELVDGPRPPTDSVDVEVPKKRSTKVPTQDVREAMAQDALNVRGEVFPLPLLGCAAELDTLKKFVSSASPGVVQIRGPRGSGRTRLLFDSCRDGVGTNDLVFLAQADPTGQATPFYPIRSLVAAILQLPESCSYEELGEKLNDFGLSRRDLPGIGELFQHEGGSLWELESPIRRREVFAATMRLIRMSGESISSVYAFEDCHLYDGPSRELVQKLCQSNQRSPSLRIIATSDVSERSKLDGAQHLDLPPLDQGALEALVAHLESRGFPGLVTLKELEGIETPGHAEQLIYYATEGGDLDECPDGLADLVAARTDSLPQVAKRVLQAAAVFGLSLLEADLVAALASSVGRIEMDASLQLLSNRSLLQREGGLLQFDSSLIREVIYEATPLDVRRSLHIAAGAILRKRDSDPAVLGFHAERADDTWRASEFLVKAGDNAARQLDDEGAAAFLNRALNATREVLQDEQDDTIRRQLVEVSIKLAKALQSIGEIGLAKGILDESRDQCGDSAGLHIRLLRASAQLRAAEGDVAGAITICRKAIAIAMRVFELDLLTETYLDLATMMLRNGESEAAARELEESIDLITMGEGASATKAPAQFWRVLLRLGQLMATAGKGKQAQPMVQHAARLAEANGSALGVARANMTLASILEASGHSRRAQSYRKQAIDDMRILGDRRTTAELLLAGTRPTEKLETYTPADLDEAKMLAEEVGWDEGVRQAQRASTRDD